MRDPRSMRRLVLLLAVLAQSATTIRLTHGVSRRSALLLGATSAYHAAPASANDAVVERAKGNSLTTDRVIYRAMNEELVSPYEINDCEALERIYKVDMKAADEMRVSNEAMMKLNAAAAGADRRALGGRNADVLKDSYEIGRLVEQRIRERASMINFKIARDCLDPRDNLSR